MIGKVRLREVKDIPKVTKVVSSEKNAGLRVRLFKIPVPILLHMK